ncbi:MAG: MATE family efflux transporter, partial [Lachnospiraceae bacterium]
TNFTEGKILLPLIKFSIPILLAVFLQAMYGAVDLIVVGQFGDASGVSAVSTGSQIMQTITGIITGLTMGTTVLLGQKIGGKDGKGAANTVGGSIVMFGIIAVVLSIIMMFMAKPFTTLMHAPEAAFSKTVQYVFICSAGIIFIVAYNVISGIFRGLGNSHLPLLFVGIACMANIAGDLILVGIFHLDATGAALATVFAQAISVVLSVIIIKKQGMGFPFTRKNICFNKHEIKSILRLGSPIAMQDALTNVSFLIITAIINSIGLIESAAIGISEKVVVFIMLVPISFMSSVSAFTAQNIGAKKPERAKKAMYYAMAIALCFGVIMFAFSFFRGDLLAGIFSKDTAVVVACSEYMKSYAIDCVLVCILFCYMGYFNGSGKTIFVMLQGIFAAFLVRIPFSYFVSKMEHATMLDIGFASPVATVFSIILCILYYRKANSNHTNT